MADDDSTRWTISMAAALLVLLPLCSRGIAGPESHREWRGRRPPLEPVVEHSLGGPGRLEWIGVLGQCRVRRVGSLAVGLRGKALAIADYGSGRFAVVDRETGVLLRDVAPVSGRAWAAALSENSHTALVGTDQGWVEAWNLDQGKVTWRVHVAEKAVLCTLMSPQGDLGVSGDEHGRISTWSIEDGRQVSSVGAFQSGVQELVWMEPGKSVAAFAKEDSGIRILNVLDGTLIREYRAPARVKALAASAGGGLLAASDADHNVLVWTMDGEREGRVIDRGSKSALHLEFLSVGVGEAVLAAVNLQFDVRLYPETDWKPHEVTPWTIGPASECLGTTAWRDQLILSGTGLRRLQVCLDAGGRARAVPVPDWRLPSGLDIDQAGRTLALAFSGESPSIQVVDARSLAPERRWNAEVSVVMGCLVSADGRHVAGYGESGCVIWDHEGTRLAALATSEGLARCAAFSPDGEIIAIGGNRGRVSLWAWREQTMLRAWSECDAWIQDLAFSPDGAQVAAASVAGSVFVRSAETGRIVRRMAGVARTVPTLAFVEGGRLAVACGPSPTIKVFDADSAEPVAELTGHSKWVGTKLAASKDGRWLFSGSADGVVFAWDLTTGQAVARYSTGESVRGLAFADGVVWVASRDGTVRAVRFTPPRSK